MITEVIQKLKKSGLSHYALPWFIILGAKNSGKTSLLKYSGLDFTEEYVFSDQISFLFSSQAVFIKIHVEPTTATLSPEFITVLNFIKKYRPKQPINNLIWLLKLPDEIQHSQIKPMRETLSQMTHYLEYLFPVSLFFSHLDYLTGFEDFFGNHINPNQVFEFNNPNHTAEILQSLALNLAQKSESIKNKFNILNFPPIFLDLAGLLNNFVKNLQKHSPYQEMPHWGPIFLISQSKFVPEAVNKLLQSQYLNNINPKNYKYLKYYRWKFVLSLVFGGIILLASFILIRHGAVTKINQIQTGVNLAQKLGVSDNIQDYDLLAQYLSHEPPAGLQELLNKIFICNTENKIIPLLLANTEHALAKIQDRWALATVSEEELLRGEYVYQIKFYRFASHPSERYAEFYSPQEIYINYYFMHSQKIWPERGQITQLAQQQLKNMNNLKNIYGGFKYWGEKFAGNIFYTEGGFEKLALPEITRLAKLAPLGPIEDLKGQLLNLYQADYKTAWVNYLSNIKPGPDIKYTPEKIQKLLATARRNIFYENINLAEYDKKLAKLDQLGNQRYLDQLAELVNLAVVSISDLKTRAAVQNILYLPLRGFYLGLLNKNLENLNFQWRGQILAVYGPKIFQKYPFYNSNSNNNPEEVSPEEFNVFFDPAQGVLAGFINRNISAYFNSQWLGIIPSFNADFLRISSQMKYMSNNFNVEIYPQPTVGLKEIRLIMGNQNYKYRNDPQEWQLMHWQLNPNEPETVLQIITSNGSVGSIEVSGPWGFFRLLQKAELSRLNNNLFKARWRIKADNGKYYMVNLVFKSPKENNFLNIILFEKCKLPREIFVF